MACETLCEELVKTKRNFEPARDLLIDVGLGEITGPQETTVAFHRPVSSAAEDEYACYKLFPVDCFSVRRFSHARSTLSSLMTLSRLPGRTSSATSTMPVSTSLSSNKSIKLKSPSRMSSSCSRSRENAPLSG